MRELGHEFSPQGEGNVCSIEFNLLYRWHATVSEGDTKWTEEEFARIFPGKDVSTVRHPLPPSHLAHNPSDVSRV